MQNTHKQHRSLQALATLLILLTGNTFANSDKQVTECNFTPSLSCIDASGVPVWNHPALTETTTLIKDQQSIYLKQNNQALSFELETGKLRWRASSGDNARYFAPVLDYRGMVYLARTDGRLEKRQASTGELIWATQPGNNWIYPPQIFNDQLISGGRDAIIWSLSPADGSIVAQEKLSQELVIPLARVDDLIIASTFDGYLTAYRASSVDKTKLETVWARNMGTVVFDIQILRGAIIASDMGGTIHSISADNGTPNWHQSLHQNALYWNNSTLGKLYSLNESGLLFSIDLNSGRLLSQHQFTGEFSRAPIVRKQQLLLFDTSGSAQTVSTETLRTQRVTKILTSN